MSAAIYGNFSSSVVFIPTYTVCVLRATSCKDAGLISVCVIEVCHWHIPSGRTMTLGMTKPVRVMSTRNTSFEVKADGA